jgi:hypothetical protein
VIGNERSNSARKKPGPKSPISNELLGETLIKCFGLSSVVAEMLSQTICPQTGRLYQISGRGVRKRISQSQFLQEIVQDEREKFVDADESQLIRAVQDGNLTAIIFTLKTLGRQRGFQ